MQNEKTGCGCETWVDLHRNRHYDMAVKILGAVKEIREDGSVREFPNTVLTAYKNKSAQGAATGSFNAIDTGRVNWSGGDSGGKSTSLVAGGAGATDYATFEFEWTNTTGASKTITSIDLGYDLGGGSEAIYFQQTGLSVVVANNEKIKYQWTITISYSSGGVTYLYRYYLAQMTATGSFNICDKIDFIDSGAGSNKENCSLEDGGAGTENYHQWNATYTASGSITIDKIALRYDAVGKYTDDDIANVAMVATDTLEAHVKITHN